MAHVDQRAVLEHLIRERREDYAGLSRLIGRNAAYIQQFIRRGTPKRLSEGDRKTLAHYFGISEAELGAPGIDRVGAALGESRLIPVPRLNIDASAGPGAFNDGENASAQIAFDERWLRRLSRSNTSDLSVIKVQGDSMVPTLSDGDDILVDAGDRAEQLRDGIYVLRRDDALLVKRIASSPAARRIIIKSDNSSYAFNGAPFSTDHLMLAQTRQYPVSARFVMNADQLKAALAASKRARLIIQLHASDAHVVDPTIRQIAVPINSASMAKKII